MSGRNQRLGWDETFMNLALLVAQRTACRHHTVGSVYVDKNNKIISLGYNGPVSGDVHCIEVGCAKIDGDPETGELKKCRGMHSEINGIINCQDTTRLRGATLYVSLLPCYDCMKAVTNAGIKEIVYFEIYERIKAGGKGTEKENEVWDLGKKAGVKIRQYQGKIYLKQEEFEKFKN